LYSGPEHRYIGCNLLIMQAILIAYLKQKKREGYCIVGLEQTANSKCLTEFKFPEKVVIVLGKEKEGVPVSILDILDVCVEIPQLGIIRSLNVHVSGALLLWSYTMQRLVQERTKDEDGTKV